MKSLKDCINALYSAFEAVPKPHTIEGCPCCVDEKALCTLLSKPLRKLGPDDLSSYASSAFLTAGNEADYLYFLPRINEISCANHNWFPDVPITGRAISETRLAEWPAERREALASVLHAVFREAMNNECGASVIDDWICATTKMGLEVNTFLEHIESSHTHVLSYYEMNSAPLMKQRLGNSYWDRSDRGYDEVLAWFKSPKISGIILDCYGMTPNHSQKSRGTQP